MDINAVISIAAWAATILMLVLFIPRDRIREAALAYLFMLFLTWLLGLAVVELGLIEYPRRLFPKATNTSFSFEYFIYPSVCAVFNLRYPFRKNRLLQFLYYASYCTAITVMEVFAEKYTGLIAYIHWTWHLTWLSLFMTFFLSRAFHTWFFRIGRDGRPSPPAG